MKNIKVEISLKEHIDNMKSVEQFQVLTHILFSCYGQKDFNNFITFLMKDMKEAEEEFDKREDLIKAYQTIIDKHSKKK